MNRLPIETRISIWSFAYTFQVPRIVEIRTRKHSHHGYTHAWCPRVSPSPQPNIVNVCHEARCVAFEMAKQEGHLLFSTDVDTPNIIFNPHQDTLYVHNEKEYWIRDWGSEGILTQFKAEHSPELLRSIAIKLDPWDRKSSDLTVLIDLGSFPRLEEMLFVVKAGSEEYTKWYRMMLRHLEGWIEYGLGNHFWAFLPHRKVSKHMRPFRLVILNRTGFEDIEYPPPPMRRRRAL